jgi:hypothetical protein
MKYGLELLISALESEREEPQLKVFRLVLPLLEQNGVNLDDAEQLEQLSAFIVVESPSLFKKSQLKMLRFLCQESSRWLQLVEDRSVIIFTSPSMSNRDEIQKKNAELEELRNDLFQEQHVTSEYLEQLQQFQSSSTCWQEISNSLPISLKKNQLTSVHQFQSPFDPASLWSSGFNPGNVSDRIHQIFTEVTSHINDLFEGKYNYNLMNIPL